MKIAELSVRRPVFAAVVSLLLVILGTLAAVRLPVREFPDVESPVVSVTTDYRGASSDVIETKITRLIEDQVAGIEGITKLTSMSRDERSIVTIEFSVNRDLEAAAERRARPYLARAARICPTRRTHRRSPSRMRAPT